MHLGGDLSVVPQSEPGSSVNWCDEKAICSNGSRLECSPQLWSALLVTLSDEARWLPACTEGSEREQRSRLRRTSSPGMSVTELAVAGPPVEDRWGGQSLVKGLRGLFHPH